MEGCLAIPDQASVSAAFLRRDFQTATDCYDQALQLDPQFIPALLNRSLAALQTGEPSRESSDAVTCNWRCKTV